MIPVRLPDNRRRKLPLRAWLWWSYVRTALVPLVVIEISFLVIYWLSVSAIYQGNVASLRKVSREFLNEIAEREAASIAGTLDETASLTTMLAAQAGRAIDTGTARASEKARFIETADGVLYTPRNDGGAAGFYSSRSRTDPARLDKAARLAALDPVMIDLVHSHPRFTSVYFNTADSYNRIFPFIDALAQYPRDMDIPHYNFYYLANGKHNPERRAVWTDAYVDPAGRGWMISSIAPVWKAGRLEGVAGIDLSLRTVIDRLVGLQVPWGGSALLIDRRGSIVALPPRAEKSFGLKELVAHDYTGAILGDTRKPEAFDLHRRPATRALADAMDKADHGEMTLDLDGPHLASYRTIPGTGWRLLVVVPQAGVYAEADQLLARLTTVGWLMAGALLAFYVLFFAYLSLRARRMSDDLAQPFGRIAAILHGIERREYDHAFAGSGIRELDELGHRVARTAHLLGDAQTQIARHERTVMDALVHQRRLNLERTYLVRLLCHAVRTPLAVVDSSAQILNRKADTIEADQLRQRVGRMRAAIERISALLQTLVTFSDERAERTLGAQSGTSTDLAGVVRSVAADLADDRPLVLHGAETPILVEEPLAFVGVRAALDVLLRSACRGDAIIAVLTRTGNIVMLHLEAAAASSSEPLRPHVPLLDGDEVGKRVAGRIDAHGLLEVLGGRIGRREVPDSRGAVVEIDLDFSCAPEVAGATPVDVAARPA